MAELDGQHVEPALDAATLFKEVQHEIGEQHRQLAALDAELAVLAPALLEGAAAEVELQHEKSRVLLAFMQAHALVLEHEKRVDEGSAETARLCSEIAETQLAAADLRAERTRLRNRSHEADRVFAEHRCGIDALKARWRLECAVLVEECHREAQELQLLDDQIDAASLIEELNDPRVNRPHTEEVSVSSRPQKVIAGGAHPEPLTPSPHALLQTPSHAPGGMVSAARVMEFDHAPADLRGLITSFFMNHTSRADVAKILAYCAAQGANASISEVVGTLDALAAEFVIFRDGPNGFRLL